MKPFFAGLFFFIQACLPGACDLIKRRLLAEHAILD